MGGQYVLLLVISPIRGSVSSTGALQHMNLRGSITHGDVGRTAMFARRVAVVVASIATTVCAQDGWFTGVGDFEGGGYSSTANDVSADGSVVVGSGLRPGREAAFRWTRDGGLEHLGEIPIGFGARAYCISPDGTAIGGQAWNFVGTEAFVWTAKTGMVAIGKLPGGVEHGAVFGIANGAVVAVGASGSSNGQAWEAFRWAPSEGMIALGSMAQPPFASRASTVTADGWVVFGSASKKDGTIGAFRWTVTSGFSILDAPYAGDSGISECSADGARLIGWNERSPVYWDASGQPIALAAVGTSTPVLGIADNAPVLVGRSLNPAYDRFYDIATIWLGSDLLFRSLQEVLEVDFGMDLGGWHLGSANAVSADGRTIVGWGFNPEGEEEGWVVRLPRLCPTDVDGDGDADEVDVWLYLTLWQACDMAADFDGDGELTSLDVLYFLRSWTGGCW